ncbi:MAG: Sec-independent protein translocase subunit TatA [Corynebacterium sp.]|nr:Sec-independent protein translocase subunit TatA [Corynebacterium sp.]
MTLGAPEVVVLIIIVLLLFGSKKLPDAARSMGRSMRIFKSEVKEMSNDDKRAEEQKQQQIEAQQQQPQVTPLLEHTEVEKKPNQNNN